MSESSRPTRHALLNRPGAWLRTFGASSRTLVRLARAQYATDLISWSYQDDFQQVWRVANFIPGWFPEASAALLYGIMAERRPKTIVEVGSYLGRSTVFFARSLQQLNVDGRVVAVDPHTGDRQQLETLGASQLATFELFQQHCRSTGVTDLVEPRVMTSLEAARDWHGAIDLLYIDGWHSYDAVIEDGRAWLPHLADRGVVVFDDYGNYADVAQAVDNLAKTGQFHLWGSVFGQAFGGKSADPPRVVQRALSLQHPATAMRRLLGPPRQR